MKRRVIAAVVLAIVTLLTSGCRMVVGPDGLTRCSVDASEPSVDRCLRPPFAPPNDNTTHSKDGGMYVP